MSTRQAQPTAPKDHVEEEGIEEPIEPVQQPVEQVDTSLAKKLSSKFSSFMSKSKPSNDRAEPSPSESLFGGMSLTGFI